MNTWPASRRKGDTKQSKGRHIRSQTRKGKSPLFDWQATDLPLDIASDNLSSHHRLRCGSFFFVRGVWVGHTKKLNDKETHGIERKLWTGTGAGGS